VVELRRRLERRLGGAQVGFSLIELVVAMGIFTLFIAVFMTSMVNLARGTTRAQVTAEASTGVLTVFQEFDRRVRYADTVNAAGAGSSGARYIEFRSLRPVTGSADVPMCTQWRFVPSTGRVETREWREASPSTTTTAWTSKLSEVIDQGGAEYPFRMIPASVSGSSRQQLGLRLRAGNQALGAEATIDTTFVARNSSQASISNSNPANLVCNRVGLRP
jgi:type II secretory pathway pseudopilin PulG